ncbi:hypothetical protein L1049_019526 [Liquidambar formosana]|uniref:Methyltransferase n=1 Tax=Liquidambar formosana TaxID=63359 RepID=A0AAP0X6K2_LIQFO
MAGPNQPYHATAKPSTASSLKKKYNNPYYLVFPVLFVTAYFLGRWQPGGTTTLTTATTSAVVSQIPCSSTNTTAISNHATVPLDFATHHTADDGSTTLSLTETIKTYPSCDIKYSEYTPCEDTARSLKYPRDRLMYRERHCPASDELLKCRVPAPHGYKNPFTWPKSRDLAWYANVPHKELTVEKAVQNWIRFEGDRFRFPGGGTMFPNGADAYIDDIGKLINLKDGSIRTAIDTGCKLGSLSSVKKHPHNFLRTKGHPRSTSSIRARARSSCIDRSSCIHRLPYPSRAFDMAHCSRCLIPWGQYNGIYLNEVDRVLRPGGYWILSGPPINWKKHWRGWERTKEDLNAEQTVIENVARSLCWNKLVEKGDIAIWQKPTNHLHCKLNRKLSQNLPFCPKQDFDKAWYTKMETCLAPLPEVSNNQETAGGKLANWPERLHAVPPRIRKGTVKGVTAETFHQDSELWKRRVSYYKTVNNQLGQAGRYRNLLDMNAYLGGFAAALIEDPVWVMNVVPVEAKINTLGVIYERGLIGTYQNWCEAMSTYPRTYDLIHANSVFSLYQGRCEADDILLEMDRILRPEGSVIIRDDVDMLVKIKRITDGMNWDSQIVDHEDGPLEREKLLFAVKSYWTAPAALDQEGSS